MSNWLYDAGREGFLDGSIDWDTQDIKFTFHDNDDVTPLQATHDNLDDISAGTVATSGNLQSKTKAAGVADAADITVTSVSGDEFESINLFYDSTVPSTSRLIAYIDTATGLPLNPNGGDVNVQWSDGSNRIFKL